MGWQHEVGHGVQRHSARVGELSRADAGIGGRGCGFGRVGSRRSYRGAFLRNARQVPGHFISGAVVGLPGIIAAEAGKSRRNAQDLIAAFEAAAAKSGVSGESDASEMQVVRGPGSFWSNMRGLRDLTIMPESNDRWYAEAVMFGSGRPTLILPQDPRPGRSSSEPWRWPGISAARPLARYLDGASAAGEGEGSRGHRSQREASRSKTLGRGIVEEPVPAWHRCRAGPGRRQGQADRRRPRGLCGFPSTSTCSSWVRTDTPVCGNLCWAARPRACCRSRRCRSCFRIDGQRSGRSKARSRCGGGSALALLVLYGTGITVGAGIYVLIGAVAGSCWRLRPLVVRGRRRRHGADRCLLRRTFNALSGQRRRGRLCQGGVPIPRALHGDRPVDGRDRRGVFRRRDAGIGGLYPAIRRSASRT